MGHICNHFSWRLDYLMWDVEWAVVQRMLIDAPRYESDDDDNNNKQSEIDFATTSDDDLETFLKRYEQ